MKDLMKINTEFIIRRNTKISGTPNGSYCFYLVDILRYGNN